MRHRNLIIWVMTSMLVTTAFAQFEPPHKKLIQYGWGVPDTDFAKRNVGEMEKRDFFDGIVLRLRGGWKDHPAHIFRKTSADPKEYSEDIANLRATKFQRFRENFAMMWGTCEKGWDWFNNSDWRAAENNARLVAYAARAGGLVGICFDPEPYDGNPWYYPDLPNAKGKSFEAYWARVRECGARFMNAIQREFPNIRILTFFWGSVFGDIVGIPDPKERMERLSKHGYGLLMAFLNGMLDVAKEGVIIVDGNEPAYYYREPEPYFRAYHLMKSRALSLIAPENRRKYAQQVQAGFALYMDLYFGTVSFEYAWGRIGHFLKPEERAKWFEHNAYHALFVTDEYVWCYNEKIDWWGTQEKAEWFKFVPPGAEEALKSAQAKVKQGKPLGFSVREMLAEAQKQADAVK
ncbi:MAG: hypothetical protein ACUVTY_11825 [Armatimonadota bacterium]